MRIVCIDPNAEVSTRDVFDGLKFGLEANGHDVIPYYFGNRFETLLAGLATRKPLPANPPLAALQWASELALAYVARHDPDWTILVSGMFFHFEALKMFRQLRRKDGSPMRVALLLTETPYDIEHEVLLVPDVDLVWTNERVAVEWLRTRNAETHYLPHAWNPMVQAESARFAQRVKAHDVVFVGSSWPERIALFEAVPWAEMGVDLGLYGYWDHLPQTSPLVQYVQAGAVQSGVTAALYRNAKIGINLFRRDDQHVFPNTLGDQTRYLRAESLGPRSYELATAKCFHLSDARAEAREVFGPDLPTFTSAAELEALVRRWLPDFSGRAAVAEALHTAVSGHSWIERARQVVSDLGGFVSRREVAA